jgi:tRNA(fMet)-specific endonuclease VapC
MKLYLADTNILSELLKKRPEARVVDHLRSLGPGRVHASEITLMEMRFGASLHPQGADLWRMIEAHVLPLVSWLEFNRAASLAMADLLAAMQRAGTPIGPWDTCIAATALANDLILVTRNTAHFHRVPGLQVENWFDAAPG